MKLGFLLLFSALFFVACKSHGGAPSTGNAKLNELVTFDDAEWMVLEAKDIGKVAKSNSDFKEEKKTDGRFIEVHYKVTNKTDKEQMLIDAPKLVDDKNTEIERLEMEGFYVPAKSKTLGLATLLPNVTMDYWTMFEVTADAKALKLQVHGIGMMAKNRNVELGL